MSKMDDLRTMREARYAARQQGAAKPRAAAKVQRAAPTEAARPEADVDAQGDGLCGHRNMSGRTCTRAQGHAEKSHRYG
jgi:hypothetical protein